MNTPAPTDAPQAPRRFRFNLPLSVIALAMFVMLCSLGTWQTSRYLEKSARMAWYQHQHGELPAIESLELPQGQDRVATLHMRKVKLTGLLAMDKAHLLTSRYRFGKLGYGVLAPLEVDGPHPRIIVDIGWVPADRLEAFLAEWPNRRVTVTGRIEQGDKLGEEAAVGEHLGLPTWRRIHTGGLARAIDGLDPDFMILAGEEASGQQIDPEDLPIDGYPPIERQPPSKNVEYALTWYGLAVTLIIVYIGFSMKRPREEDEEGLPPRE